MKNWIVTGSSRDSVWVIVGVGRLFEENEKFNWRNEPRITIWSTHTYIYTYIYIYIYIYIYWISSTGSYRVQVNGFYTCLVNLVSFVETIFAKETSRPTVDRYNALCKSKTTLFLIANKANRLESFSIWIDFELIFIYITFLFLLSSEKYLMNHSPVNRIRRICVFSNIDFELIFLTCYDLFFSSLFASRIQRSTLKLEYFFERV